MDPSLMTAHSTVGICKRFGGDEVLSQAILDWLFEGASGEVVIITHDDQDHVRRARLTLTALPVLVQSTNSTEDGLVHIHVSKELNKASNQAPPRSQP